MMANFLSIATFNKGITSYLNGNKYGNADQDNLWSYLSDAAHEDETLPADMSVKTVMDTWTLQMGYPYVSFQRNGQMLTATQRHFLNNPNSTVEDGNFGNLG